MGAFATKENTYKNEKRKQLSGLFGFALREDDLVHEEEDHHGDAAVEHGGADVVDPLRPPACADRWGRPTAR